MVTDIWHTQINISCDQDRKVWGTRGPLILGRGGHRATLLISIYQSWIWGEVSFWEIVILSWNYVVSFVLVASRHPQGRIKLALVEKHVSIYIYIYCTTRNDYTSYASNILYNIHFPTFTGTQQQPRNIQCDSVLYFGPGVITHNYIGRHAIRFGNVYI